MNLYPLKLRPILRPMIWGGKKLSEFFSKSFPIEEKIGESWEIADYGSYVSIVRNGSYQGRLIDEIIVEFGTELYGSNLRKEQFKRFPLLVKFIDASDKLSLQVHPDDSYGAIHEGGELGKTEMWYIISVEPGAKLACGTLPGTDLNIFMELLNSGNIEKCLNQIEIKPGDAIFIPAGCPHALGAGIVVWEIQETSDLTYRIFDWDRVGVDGKPRPLHINKAFDVLRFDLAKSPLIDQLSVNIADNLVRYLAICRYFVTEFLNIYKSFLEDTLGESFHILTAIEGKGEIIYGPDESVVVVKGETVLVPASIGKYFIEPEDTFSMLKAYAPKSVDQAVKRLYKTGIPEDRIQRIVW